MNNNNTNITNTNTSISSSTSTSVPNETTEPFPSSLKTNPLTENPPTIEDKPQHKSDVKEIHFLNQGAYGCVFRPEITCDGEVGDANYITKIQKRSKTVENEMDIGNKLKINIPNYEYYYAPIIENCSVNIKNIDTNEIQECKLFDKYNETISATTSTNQPNTTNTTNAIKTMNTGNSSAMLSKYISTKIRYVGSQNLEVYFLNLPVDPNILIKKLFTTYTHLSKGIDKMLENQMIHFDVKDTNIMYDEYCQFPIFIDFGLSIDLKKVNPQNYEDTFYTSKYYGYWSIDIYILSQITQRILKTNPPSIKENPVVTEEKIKEIIHSFTEECVQFVNKYAVPFANEEIEVFKNKQIDRLKPFIGKKWEDVFHAIFVPKVYEKWDKYGLSMTYYTFIKSLGLDRWKENRWLDYMMNQWKKDILEVIPLS